MVATFGTESVAHVDRWTWDGHHTTHEPDVLVREEPLEIRVNGAPVAVVMRTPGRDADLVRGFLVTERIVAHAEDVQSVRPCTIAETPEAEGNVMRAVLKPHVAFDLARFRRNLFASSSCGICGKATIESALASAAPFPAPPAPSLPRSMLSRLVPTMRSAQVLFDQTGGLHAAAAFSARGTLLDVAEDIGRHNAVDKVVGALSALGARSRGDAPGEPGEWAPEEPADRSGAGRVGTRVVRDRSEGLGGPNPDHRRGVRAVRVGGRARPPIQHDARRLRAR